MSCVKSHFEKLKLSKKIRVGLIISAMVVSSLGILISLIPLFAWCLSHIEIADNVKYISLFIVSLLLLPVGIYGLITEIKKLIIL